MLNSKYNISLCVPLFIKLYGQIALFPLTQPPSGTETSAKGCFVIAKTPCIASTRGVEADDGPLSTDKCRNGVKINISSAFVFNIQGLPSSIIVIKP